MTQQHKRKAFASFVREHQASLRSFLRVIGAKPDSVDDLAQDGWAPKNWSIENEMVFGQRKETIDEEEASHDRADHPHLAGS